jgi:hypothetical protein
VKLRKRCNTGSATSNPEPFLHKPQKRFGAPASFNRAWVQSGAARKGSPPAHPASFNRAWVHSGAARKGSPPAARDAVQGVVGKALAAVGKAFVGNAYHVAVVTRAHAEIIGVVEQVADIGGPSWQSADSGCENHSL